MLELLKGKGVFQLSSNPDALAGRVDAIFWPNVIYAVIYAFYSATAHSIFLHILFSTIVSALHLVLAKTSQFW